MLGNGLYVGIHLDAYATKVVLVKILDDKQEEAFEMRPIIYKNSSFVREFHKEITDMMNSVYKKMFDGKPGDSKPFENPHFKYNSVCFTFSDFDRRYLDETRDFLTTYFRDKMTSTANGKAKTKEFAVMHLAEACLRSYFVPSTKSKKSERNLFDAAVFLGFDSGCRVIFASDDSEEGVRVTGNTHTELVGSWLWIGKHAINKMLDEKDNARQNYSKAKKIEEVFKESFELTSVYEAINVLHDSYKYKLIRFAEKLAREHSEDPLVREVFFDAGVECAKVISQAITSIPYKNRYYRQPLVTSHFQNGERRPLRLLLSGTINISLEMIMEGIRHELTHNPTVSALEIFWKAEESAMDAAAMAAHLDGTTLKRFKPEPLAILTAGENSTDWSDIYRLPAPGNKWKHHDQSSNRSSVEYAPDPDMQMEKTAPPQTV